MLSGFFPISRPEEFFSPVSGTRWLADQWGVASLASFGVEDNSPSAGCAAAALKYFSETQFGAVNHVRRIYPLRPREYLHLDVTTQRNLELLDEGGPSLWGTLNRCRSPMGRRTLREWILRPLLDEAAVRKRQDGVEYLLACSGERRRLRDLLSECRDVERATSRLSMGTGTPRDLGAVRDTLRLLPSLLPLCTGPLEEWTSGLPDFSGLAAELCSALEEDLPRMRANGGIIRPGYDRELDEWRDAGSGASAWMDAYLEKIRTDTDISKIRAGYNKVFGYYLEVSKGSLGSVPDFFIRKQTLVNAERFITEEMKVFEERMESATAEISRREGELYDRLAGETLDRWRTFRPLVRPSLSWTCWPPWRRRPGRRGIPARGELRVRPHGEERPPPRGGGCPHRLALRSQFPQTGRGREADRPDHGAEHGGKVHLPAERRTAGDPGPDGELRPGGGCGDRAVRPDLHPHRGPGRPRQGQQHLHGGDGGDGQHPPQRDGPEPGDPGRGGAGNLHLRRHEYRLGRAGIPGRRVRRLAEGALRHPLPRTYLPRGAVPLHGEPEHGGEGERRGHLLPPPGGEGSADRSYGIEVARLAGLPRPVLRRAFDLLQRFEREERTGNFPKKKREFTGARQMDLFEAERHGIVEELAAIEPDGLTPFRALELLYKLSEKSREVLRPENHASS